MKRRRIKRRLTQRRPSILKLVRVEKRRDRLRHLPYRRPKRPDVKLEWIIRWYRPSVAGAGVGTGGCGVVEVHEEFGGLPVGYADDISVERSGGVYADSIGKVS